MHVRRKALKIELFRQFWPNIDTPPLVTPAAQVLLYDVKWDTFRFWTTRHCLVYEHYTHICFHAMVCEKEKEMIG